MKKRLRQGLLAIVFLLFIGTFGPTAWAAEITQDEVNLWQTEPNIQSSADKLYHDALQDNIPQLQEALHALPLPDQEVARFLLLKKIEEQGLVLTPRLAIFVQSQQKHKPIYQVSESGDGYTALVPVFNTSLIADRLIQNWNEDQAVLDFIIAAENEKLELATWLTGNDSEVKKKEALFLEEADSLSPKALNYFVSQLSGDDLVKWLPPNSILVKLAQLTKDEGIYRLLWKTKVDDSTLGEIRRLTKVGDNFSVNQVIDASENPALKTTAIEQLVTIKPMPLDVQRFLMERLNRGGDGLMVAMALSKSEHQDWLMMLLKSGQIEGSKSLMNSISMEMESLNL
ncbi:MAG: hypothetical protein ACK5NC_02485 [Vibrio sp.]